MWVCMPTSELNNRNCFQQFQAYLKMYSTSLLFWDIFSLVPCFKVLIVFCIVKNFNVGSQKCLKEHPIHPDPVCYYPQWSKRFKYTD